MHFWTDVARRYGRASRPRKTSLNGTMPALTNRSVGSPAGTSDALGTRVCARSSKNRRKASRSCAEVTASLPARGRAVRRGGLREQALGLRDRAFDTAEGPVDQIGGDHEG